MNKKTLLIVLLVLIVIIAGIVIWSGQGSGTQNNNNVVVTSDNGNGATPSPVVPVTATTQVSSKTSQYKNAELGFSVNYPSNWEVDNTDSGVMFVMPIDSSQVTTMNKLEADITVNPGKCSFPPVVTVTDRGTMVAGSNSFNMISLQNSVQGRQYFNRMYSLANNGVCYIFSFASISFSPESKGLTGSNATQAQNNNKALVNSSDTDFTNMVKSFSFVASPQGEDETQAAPKK